MGTATDPLEEDEDGVINTPTGKVKVRETLDNTQNMAYTGDIYIGTPPQKVRAVFDTGSANPWILSKQAAEANNRTLGNSYDPSKSTTY